MRVTARRWKRPTVSQATAADATGAERDASLVGIGTQQQGDIAAIGATVPEMTLLLGANGPALSTLGLPASQTSVTMNGLTFNAGDLPRELFAPARVGSSVFDVSQGGFSGAQLAFRTYSGSAFTNGTVTARLAAPLANAPGAPMPTLPPLGLTGSRSGPALAGRVFYNVAASMDRSAERASTLWHATSRGVDAAGVAPAVALATFHVLDSLGVPTQFDQPTPPATTTRGSAFARLDLPPTRLRTADVIAQVSWNRTDALPLGPLTTIAPAGRRGTTSVALLGEHSRLLGGRFLAHTRGGISTRHTSADPRAALPGGTVLVPAADSGVTAITFGGAGALASGSDTWRVEARHGLSWYSENGQHLWRLTAQASRDALAATEPTNALGRFVYGSLQDLRGGQAASFRRELGRRTFGGSAWNAGLSLGDQWRPADALVLQYGVRLDGDRVSGTTAQATSWGLSPRVGFAWTHGTIAQAGFGPRPRGTLRGGIGAFRGVLTPDQLRPLVASAGAEGGLEEVECIGAATPTADWRQWGNGAAFPESCAAGAATATRRNSDRVTLADDFSPATSWRGNVSWSGGIGFGLQITADVTASRTRGLTGMRYTDVSLTPAFRALAEADRPVYVDATRIDERLGVAPFVGAYGSLAGRRSELHSDLGSRALQFSTSLARANVSPADRVLWGVGYALTNAANEASGFDQSTAGDPRSVEWMPSPFAARHRLTGFAALRFTTGAFVSLGVQAQSGLPFTPLVGGDVNGDGLVNDRAFVTEPLGRRYGCLRHQVGRLAAAASCHGSSQVTMNASLSVPGVGLRLPARSTVVFGVVNPLAGLDELLHGGGRKGWGQTGAPDPVLVYPVGFDASRREFRYDANASFGDTRRDALAHWLMPRLTIDVRVPFSRPQHEQLLRQVMAPGRERPGARLTAAQVKQRYVSFGIINPVHALYAIRDSLHLTQTQRAAMDQVVTAFDARLDTIWTPLAHTLAAADRDYDRVGTLRTIRSAQRGAWDALEVAVGDLRAILTATRLELIDPAISALLDPGAVARLRRTELRF